MTVSEHPNTSIEPTPSTPTPTTSVAPQFTAEEAEALARGMRVEARLPQIAAMGTVLGIVCAVAAISPLLASDDHVARALAENNLSGWLSVVLPVLLAWMLPLIAFYGLWLHRRRGESTPAEIENKLRKIRRLLVVCMFASVGAVIAVLSNGPAASGMIRIVLYALCCTACVAMAGDVRKALGEFESAEQRHRRRMVRGFAVELKAGGKSDDAPRPVLPVDSADALPAAPPRPAMSARTIARVSGKADARRDLRAILHTLAAAGVILYALRTSASLSQDVRLDDFHLAVSSFSAGGAAGDKLAVLSAAAADLARYVLSFAAPLWVVWGLLVLSVGARFRLPTLLLAWLTLLCAIVLTIAPPIAAAATAAAAAPKTGYGPAFMLNPDNLTLMVADIIYAFTMCVVLTRPRVIDLFVRGSESGESDDD
jgi:hypothetical protein